MAIFSYSCVKFIPVALRIDWFSPEASNSHECALCNNKVSCAGPTRGGGGGALLFPSPLPLRSHRCPPHSLCGDLSPAPAQCGGGGGRGPPLAPPAAAASPPPWPAPLPRPAPRLRILASRRPVTRPSPRSTGRGGVQRAPCRRHSDTSDPPAGEQPKLSASWFTLTPLTSSTSHTLSHACNNTHAQLHLHARWHMHVVTLVCTCAHVHIYSRTHTHTHIHTLSRTRGYAHTHTHTRALGSSVSPIWDS